MQTAQILWKTDNFGNTVPTSATFDDVYFSHAHGLSESCYVFGDGNGLTQRFDSALKNNEDFTICETGFGTGLNFLMVCELWVTLTAQHPNSTARLHFISTEKFPLNRNDLQKALEVWQGSEILSLFINELIDNYPLAIMGCHRRNFRHNINLDLWLGDASDSLTALARQPHAPKVDAWFLDGFAPSKNSELWSSTIFDAIAKLSKTSTTLATFTSAGTVKRELIRIGATVKKIKGFGRKREMLTACFLQPLTMNSSHDTYTIREQTKNEQEVIFGSPITPPKTALVVGAGVAGLCMAYSLANMGVRVTLIDEVAPLAGASGNPRALFAPKLSQLSTVHEHLPTLSYLYATHFYQRLNELSGLPIFEQTGVADFLEPANKSTDKLRALVAEYPDELIQMFDALTHHLPSNFCHYQDFVNDFAQHNISTWLGGAGLITPKLLAKHILSHPNITYYAQRFCADDLIHYPDTPIILCTGYKIEEILPSIFCRKIRGQISYTALSTPISLTPIKYDGYCTTFVDDGQSYFLMGASFVRNDIATDIREAEHLFNLDKLFHALPNLSHAITPKFTELMGRASIRAQTPDYHPIVGKIRDNLYVLTGLGSKGFSFAPLCAEILASILMNIPMPVSTNILEKINPHRPKIQHPPPTNQKLA